MKNILNKIPSTIKSLSVFIFGVILLLHTLGFFTHGLDKAIIAIAIIMIIYGFIELGGPSKFLSLFSKNNSSQSDIEQDSDDELF